MLDDTTWRQHLLCDRIADKIPEMGDQWRRAVRSVDRQVLVPGFWRLTKEDGFASDIETWEWQDDTRLNRESWLDSIYSDALLVTSVRRLYSASGRSQASVVSISAKPSLIVQLLERLNPQLGERVLEIGTGPGYSTALLCHALGESNVSSIELDGERSATARDRLSTLGFRPTLIVADGSRSISEPEAFDHIISMCAVHEVPRAWIRQCRPGGTILTATVGPLMREAQLRLTAFGDDVAIGMFQTGATKLPTLAPGPTIELVGDQCGMLHQDDVRSITNLVPRCLIEGTAWAFVAQLHIGDLLMFAADDSTMHLHASDQSWATVSLRPTPGRKGFNCRQGGPRRIWTALECLHEFWQSEGRPGVERFGITLSPDGRTVWLDHPGNIVQIR